VDRLWRNQKDGARRGDRPSVLELERRCAPVNAGDRQVLVDVRGIAVMHERRVQRFDAREGILSDGPRRLIRPHSHQDILTVGSSSPSTWPARALSSKTSGHEELYN
jgi:hypothetical protein